MTIEPQPAPKCFDVDTWTAEGVTLGKASDAGKTGMRFIDIKNRTHTRHPLFLQLSGGGRVAGFGCSESKYKPGKFTIAAEFGTSEDKAAVRSIETMVSDHMVANWATYYPTVPLDEDGIRSRLKPMVRAGAPKANGEGSWPDALSVGIRPKDASAAAGRRPKLVVVDEEGKAVDTGDLGHRPWTMMMLNISAVYMTSATDERNPASYGITARVVYLSVGERGGFNVRMRPVTEVSLGKTFNVGSTPTSGGHKVVDIADVDGGKVGLVFNGGGIIPKNFGVEASESFGGVTFTFGIDNMEEDAAMRRLFGEFQDALVTHRATYYPSNTKSDESVRDMMNMLITARRPKLDKETKQPTGEEWPATVKGKIDDADVQALSEGKSAPSGLVIEDTEGAPVSLHELPGRRWVRVEMKAQCLYIQPKAAGVSRRIRKVVVKAETVDEVPSPLPVTKRVA